MRAADDACRVTWKIARRALAAALALPALAGCGAGAPPLPSTTALPAGVQAPDAGGQAALRIAGAVTTHNAGAALRLDHATLARLGLLKIDLYEPFKKRRMAFQAIPLRNLLRFAGVRRGATVVHLAALDDYVVDLSLHTADAAGVYLALRNGDGSPIPVDGGGPIRIVFAAGAPGAGKESNWIWSLNTVTVR